MLSGISGGIICTIAGQIVSEGQLNWSIAPWMRRLVTRGLSITPSIIIVVAVGKDGLSATLIATQVALSYYRSSRLRRSTSPTDTYT
jgi:metal iron transporter